MPLRQFLLNIPIDCVSRTEALVRCGEFLKNDTSHHVTTVNPEFIVAAHKNVKFFETLQASDLSLADGAGVVLAIRRKYGIKTERIAGIDFMLDICKLAAEKKYGIFLLGGRGVADTAAMELKHMFHGLTIIGTSEDPAYFQKNPSSGIDILFVAYGAPKQEVWIAEHRMLLPNVKVFMGVGGAFDILSGKIKRAPQFMRELYLEWLWRLFKEPKRLPRIFNATIYFTWLVLWSRP